MKRIAQLGLSTLGVVLLVILLLFLFGSFPVWQHSSSWGYGPSGGLGFILLVVIVLVLLDKI